MSQSDPLHVIGTRGRNETPEQRADRNYIDLLQELRVTETGVQILFSLLLTVPFSNRFTSASDFQRRTYFVALLLAGSAIMVLIAPVAYHRLLFARGEKPQVVRVASRLALTGLVLLLLAVTAVLLLVTDVLFSTTFAAVTAGSFGGATLVLWFVPALLRRRRT